MREIKIQQIENSSSLDLSYDPFFSKSLIWTQKEKSTNDAKENKAWASLILLAGRGFFHLSCVRTRQLHLIGKVWQPKSIVCSLQGNERNRKLALTPTGARFWGKKKKV